MVFVSTVQMNHAAPASELIQSMVAPSCSAAKTRSPPSFAADSVFFFLLLPHAAATSESAMTATTNARKLLLPRTRSRPPFALQWTSSWMGQPLRFLSLQPDGQDHCSEGKDESGGNREPIEVALDHGRARGRLAHTAAEHV